MYLFFKRVIDFLLSLLMLPFIILLVIIVGIAIKIDDGGSVFYFPERIGKNRKIFKMYKFRSMKENAPDIRTEDGSTYNSPDDDRVTRVGSFIRKTSIDEIPQIINVLKGEMSFIGPRPDSAMWIDNYTEEEKIIHDVLPGLSGYNQVVNRNASSTKEKLANDIYYVENISFMLDAKIFFLTIKNILVSKNVYRDEGE